MVAAVPPSAFPSRPISVYKGTLNGYTRPEKFFEYGDALPMTDPREYEGLAREMGAFKDIELEILKESTQLIVKNAEKNIRFYRLITRLQ